MKRFAGALVVLLAALVVVSGHARADQDIHGSVVVIFATHEAGTVDPLVAQEPALHQPPFDTFRSMRVLSHHEFVVGTQTPYTHWIENGRTLRIELLEHAGSRLAARVSISRANNAPDFLPGATVETDPGVPFVVAGQSYQEPELGRGTLVLLVRLGVRPPPTTLRLSPGLVAPLRLAVPLARPPAPPVTPSPAPTPHPPNGASAARKNSPPAAPPPPHPPPHEAAES